MAETRDLFERLLKTIVGKGREKEKGAKEGEVVNEQERAKTRPDGNDPKEFRGVSPVPLFLPVLFLQFTTFFCHTFLPSLSRTLFFVVRSFYSGPRTITNALRQPAEERLKQVPTAMTSNCFFFFCKHLYLFSLSLSLSLMRTSRSSLLSA